MKAIPYPLLVILLVCAAMMMRCVGEYGQDQEREQRAEERAMIARLNLPPCDHDLTWYLLSDGRLQPMCVGVTR